MEKAKVSFVKFENNDVIATSGIDYNSDLWVPSSMWTTYTASNPADVAGTFKGYSFNQLCFEPGGLQSDYISPLTQYVIITGDTLKVYPYGYNPSGTPANVATSLQDVLRWIEINVQQIIPLN